MNKILQIIGMFTASCFLLSANLSYSEDVVEFGEIIFSTEKGSAEFDTSKILDINFLSATEITADDISDISGDIEYPSSLDLRDYGLVQNPKSQGSYGTCWTQTAVDSAETSIIKSVPDIDLSEWHLAYYSYTGGEEIDLGDMAGTESVFQYGGSSLIAANMWAQWKGPVTEKSDLQYGSYDILTDTELQEKYVDSADYHLKNAYFFDFKGDDPETRNTVIKDFLINGQSVDVSYYNDSSFYDYTHNSYMSNQDKSATHSVTIIGYDDDFPAENFTENARPENNGAWLAKNSWGNTWQDNGFFWISYEEPSLCEFSVFELEDSDNYATNYYYDTFISNQSMRASSTSTTSYMANIFQAEGDEWLQAISCNFASPNSEYEISVYTNLKNASNPKSGTKVYTQSGTNTLTGYQTIEFDKNIVLSEGETFSIVIKMTNDTNPYVISIESCVSVIDNDTGEILDLSNHTKYEQIKEYTNKNESFYSSNGKSWTDVTNAEYHYSDYEKKLLYTTLISTYGEDFLSGFDENFGDDDVVIAEGNIPIKAFTNPINHVSFSKNSGFIYSDETVELSCDNSQDIYYSINDGEYVLYTEPITISETCTISATTDFEVYSSKEYTPAYGKLNRLGYTFSKNTSAVYITPQSDGNYVIDVDENQDSIILFPISQGEIEIDGTSVESYQLTNALSLEYGENVFEISVQTENAIPSIITLTVNRGDSEILMGDVNNDGLVNSSDASEVLAEYARVSAGEVNSFTDKQKNIADFNSDSIINSSDASEILSYYAKVSSGD